MKKYNYNESFFDVIDTEEKAYILGLLYADGCNLTQKNTVVLELQERDKEILKTINSILETVRPLTYTKTSEDKWSNKYKLSINSKKISLRLTELGCVSKKTTVLKYPTKEQVPKYLENHFVRGYFDGDGYISKDLIEVSITSNVDFIIGLQKVLNESANLPMLKIYTRHEGKNSRTIKYRGTNNVKKLGDYLYKGATIYMKRKKDRFDKVVPLIKKVKNTSTGVVYSDCMEASKKEGITYRKMKYNLDNNTGKLSFKYI